MDIIISLVKMVGSYGRDVWDSVSVVWKDNHLHPPQQDDEMIWNGGETFRIDDDENTPTPYDDVVIKYDGIMDEVEE
tara:strand:+ start:73 stop:303 length:231 start_codon:yes stop_codon:yes gene_type:complete